MRRVRNLSLAGVLVGLLAGSAAGVAAQEGAELRVAADGSGDFETISAAIEAASAGDTILIAPGTYVEHLEITKDLTIAGDGDREDIVIAPPEDLERRVVEYEDELWQVAIWADGADLVLEGLTIGPVVGYSVVTNGGDSVIRDIATVDFIGIRGEGSLTVEDSALTGSELGGPNESTFRDNVMQGSFVYAGAHATFEGNEVVDSPIVAEGDGRVTVIGNSFTPTEDEAGVVIGEPRSYGYIADNTITGGWVGIVLEYAVESTAERNTIVDAATGIIAVESGSVIRDNAISGAEEYGIQTVGEGMTVEGNTVDGGRVGLFAMLLPPPAHPDATDFQAGPFIRDNAFTGASHFGVLVEDAPIELSGNVVCAEREPLKIESGEDLVLGTNEICDPEAE